MIGENKPVEIKLGSTSEWRPSSREIILSPELEPLDAAHEIAHFKLEHDISGSAIVEMVQEKDAWMVALRKIDPDEIVIYEIARDLGSYVDEVGKESGRHSPQHMMALRLKREVLDYALKRREELS